jgi:hypothetical protein
MILRISVNLVKFCASEVGEVWWRFFYFAWRKRGGGERGVVAKEGLWMVYMCRRVGISNLAICFK